MTLRPALERTHHLLPRLLWRPVLKDPDDDMLLELAVEAGCDRIVTHNTKDFAGIERFGPSAVTPQYFLQEIGVIP